MADSDSSFTSLAARWEATSPSAAVDAGLLTETRGALFAAQPDDLPAVSRLTLALEARLAGPSTRAAARRALAALFDTVRRRFFVRALPPPLVQPWLDLLLPALERSDYCVGDLLLSREETDPKVIALRVLGSEACELTVADVARRTRALARGMLTLLRGDEAAKVAILADNGLEAALCDLACLSNGIVDLPLPANAVADQLVFMLRHSGARVLLVDGQEQLSKILPSLASLPELREVVVFDRAVADRNGLLSLHQMVDQGSGGFDDQEREARAARVRSRDLATVMYTSGSTGRPKAIAFSHLNVISKRLCRGFALPRVGEGDVFLAYLPLYHTFGRWLELTGSLWWGATYVFARSTARPSLLEDFRSVRPTVFISVPKKWLELHEAALAESASESHDEVAATLQALCGGRLHHGLSAAGYLDPEVFKTFHRAGVELCSGYGMTEATGGITMTPPGEYREGSIGKALPGIELRRSDDGELLIRGPYVSAGYLNPGEGDVGADAEGWFATGDLFAVDNDGHYQITGRKKEIYKNRMGQTVAPQRVENLFRDFDSVAQAFLVGDHREYNTLLIWPDFEGKPGLKEMPPDQLRGLLSSLIASANRFLAPFERVVAFEVLPRALDLEHGELTAKLSFKREVVQQNWAAVIDGLYGEKHLTLHAGGVLLQVPKWVLRELSVLQTEVALEKGWLIAGGRPLRVGSDPAAPGSLRLGDLAYPADEGVLDLGAVLARPNLWLGNEGMRAFLGGEAFLSLVARRRSSSGGGLRIDPRLWPQPEAERLPRLLERVEQSEVTFLSIHSAAELLRAERPEARRAVAHLAAGLSSGSEHAELCRAILRRTSSAPDEEIRRLGLAALLPSEAPERLEETLRLFLDRLGPAALRDEDLARLGDRSFTDGQLQALVSILELERTAAHELLASERRVLVGAMRLLTACATSQPRWYSRARVALGRLAHHRDDELAARAGEELDRLRRDFSSWIGPNLRLAIEPETGSEYRWKDVVVFDANVAEQAREILLRALAETTLVRASVFLFGHGALISLADLPRGGARVKLLGSRGGKSIYRLSLATRAHDGFEVAINLADGQHPLELKDEMGWLLASGGAPPLVEAFGGYYPEYGAFTEEYVPGEQVAAQIDRLTGQGELRRLDLLFPFLAQTAFACHVAFWDRTGRTVALLEPAPEAFILPSHDYQDGARMVSIVRRAPCADLGELIDRFRASFLAPLGQRSPRLAGAIGDELLLAAAVEALGVGPSQEVLQEAAAGPRAPLVTNFIDRLRREGHTPFRLDYAARRWARWLVVNPGATVEARGTMLGELWRTYRLSEVEKRAPDTRIRFFRRTAFAGARPDLAAQLDRLMTRARLEPIGSVDLAEQVAAHREAVQPTPEEDYFLARMTWRYLAPSDEASLVSVRLGDKQIASVMMALRDEQGDRFRARAPVTPREVARLLQLFQNANLAVAFTAEHDCLLALDDQDAVIGGLFWRWLEPGRAHMDKLVVARSHRGRGIGGALVRLFMRRLQGLGAHTLGTGYFQAEYFKRLGFRTDPTSGGLVVDLEAGQPPDA